MPQCKKSGCREPALPTGKRYCARHKQEYLEKQMAYEVVRATLPDCTCCGVKLSKTRADAGESICGLCAQRLAKEQAEYDEREALNNELNACKTVGDLRNFIREHLL